MTLVIQEKSKEFLDFVRKGEKVLIVGHIHPDGDCLGSMLALARALKRSGKDVYIGVDRKDIPSNYEFLLDKDRVFSTDELSKNFDLAISVDAPNKLRLGSFAPFFERALKKINIDHHTDNQNFGDLNIVVGETSSTSEIVYWLFKGAGFEVNYDIALPLYVGIVTDTGRFQYSNTLPSTFEVACELIKSGVSPVYVFRNVYENIRPEVLKLLGLVLERVKNSDGLFWSFITPEELDNHSVNLAETENFIDYIRSIRGCRVAALFKKVSNSSKSWKVSLRSRGEVNVQKIAAAFGGGGHVEASGCEIDGDIDEAVNKLFSEYLKAVKGSEGLNE